MSGSVNSADGEIGFQIAPMVDVVFVLMLFFMAAAGAQITEKEMSVALPGPPPNGSTSEPGLVIVEISADGQVVANNTAFGTPADKQLPSLRDWLKTVRSFDDKDVVLIRPNSQTHHERIVDVLDACAAAGIKSLTFG